MNSEAVIETLATVLPWAFDEHTDGAFGSFDPNEPRPLNLR